MTESKKAYGGLWLNKNRTDEKQPVLTGSIQLNDKKYLIAIWKSKNRENRKPDYTISISELELKPADKIEGELELD